MLFSAVTECTRSLGIQSELRVLGSSCVVVIASDNQIVMDHSRRCGHSVASKHVGLRGLRFQEAIADETLALEKVHTVSNRADVCATALPGVKICELRRFVFVFFCHSENTMGADPEIWSLSQLDDRSSGVGTLWTPVLLNSRTRLSLMERVDFACLSFVVRLTS